MTTRTSLGWRTRVFVLLLLGATWWQLHQLQRPLTPPVPTAVSRARIMGCRMDVLENSLDVYRETGHLLLERVPEHGIRPLNSFDDVGTVLLVPPVVDLLDLSLDETIEWFYTLIVALGVVAAVVGWCVQLRSVAARAVAILFVLHFAVELSTMTDVYVVQGALALGACPWILWWARRAKYDAYLLAAISVGAVVMSVAQLIRSHTATPLLLLGGTLILASRSFTARQKATMAAAFVIAWFVPRLALLTVQHQRDAFLHRELGRSWSDLSHRDYRHPFWHSVYIGLGYQPNPYGIVYSDTCADTKAKELAGDDVRYMGTEYEAALRGECIRLVSTDPRFVLSVLLAKARVALLLLFEYVNVGLLAFVFAPFDRWRTLGFLFAIGFASLFGVLVMPERWYLLGMFGMGVGFAADSTGRLLDHHVPIDWSTSWASRAGEFGYRVARATAVVAVVLVLTSEGRAIARTIGHRLGAVRAEAVATAIAARLESSDRRLPVRASFRPMLWSVTEPGASLDWLEDGALLQTSSRGTAYQLAGPRIEVGPEVQLALRVDVEVFEGAILLGGLDDEGAWAFQRGLPVGRHVAVDVIRAADTESLGLCVTNATVEGKSSRARINRIDVLDASGIVNGDEPVQLGDAARLDVARESIHEARSSGATLNLPVLDSIAPTWWTAPGAEIDREGDEVVLRTDESASGYQVMGLATPTPTNDPLVLHADLEVLEGAVVVGFLDDTGHWVYQQRFAIGSHERIDVLPGNAAVVQLVVANATTPATRSLVRIRRIESKRLDRSGAIDPRREALAE